MCAPVVASVCHICSNVGLPDIRGACVNASAWFAAMCAFPFLYPTCPAHGVAMRVCVHECVCLCVIVRVYWSLCGVMIKCMLCPCICMGMYVYRYGAVGHRI